MNPLLKFGIRNIRNSRIRSVLAILAVVLGVMLITTLLILTDSLISSVTDTFSLLSGVIIVQERNSPDPSFSLLNGSVADEIIAENMTNGRLEGLMDSFAKEIWHIELANNSGFGFISAIGVKPSDEISTVGILSDQNIIQGRSLSDSDLNATVIGSLVAQSMNLGVGDYMAIAEISFQIVGIFSTGSLIDTRVYIPFEVAKTFRSAYENSFISTLLIKPANLVAGREIKEFINANFASIHRIEATDFDEIAEQSLQYLDLTSDFAFYIGIISVVIGSLSVFNAILMSVYERKKEIAVLKATGWSDREVGLEVFLESMIISSIGGILGLVFGVFVATIVTDISNFLTLSVQILTLVKSYSYAVVLGILAGLYPAYRAMKIDPIVDLSG